MIFKNAELFNIEEVHELKEEGVYALSRIPERVRAELNDKAKRAAYFGCGTEIRFNIEDEFVKLVLKRAPKEGAVLDTGIVEIYFGSFQASWEYSPRILTTEAITEIIIKKPKHIKILERLTEERGLPFDPNLVRVILPYDWKNYLIDIEGNCAPPRAEQVPNQRYLAYGSSITHGSSTVGPNASYAMRTAELLEADLINLGFAGGAYMEAAMADYIAARSDWDFATLEMGINVIEQWSVEQFADIIDYFISKIALANKDKWIFCMDVFTCYLDYENSDKIIKFREIIKEKVAKHKLPKLVHLSGTDLLKSVTGLTIDLTHPSALGMEEIARKLSYEISRYSRNLNHSLKSGSKGAYEND
ncbi:SGNH/GDSL hydrolase family protein [Paenibacillus sp. Soil724D2]|uniref:SGNH/GDSL hydrolase family protein n=1 Tax=Paenibacillus sp. (strain Soil724D2) TaxID=1736392 RepID=UPI0007147660|nr:SGNH/GDSL hydrolase family protein [Paenibacillus sp. Soil724D2]KRE46706.1 hypothetical protein ASG85_29070 [Paenibacillus sp. Soil724D2]